MVNSTNSDMYMYIIHGHMPSTLFRCILYRDLLVSDELKFSVKQGPDTLNFDNHYFCVYIGSINIRFML